MHKGLRFGFLLAAGVAIPVLTNGCSAVTNAQNSLCCKGFEPGADMSTPLNGNPRFGTLDVSVSGQFVAFAQASGDLNNVAVGALADVTNACRSIALDMGSDPNDATLTGKTGVDLMNAWCDLAVGKIKEITSANVTLTVAFDPPQCTASLKAEADCQARCDVSGKCDIKVNPPTCTGGTLEIECKGGCDVTAQAPTIDCTGSCTGQCSGSCEAQGGVTVDCDGKCEGTCAAGGTANGTGIQADGTCKGTCNGKCTLRNTATVSCKGTCSGSCNAKCDVAPGQVSVKCSGSCSADYQPIECKGGKLEGGCKVSADCQANCNASVQATAQCTPGQLAVTYSGNVAGIEGKVNALIATLEKNLPALVVVLKGRGQQFADTISATVQGGATVIGSGKLSVEATACLPYIAQAVTDGVTNFGGALQGSVKVTGAVGVK